MAIARRRPSQLGFHCLKTLQEFLAISIKPCECLISNRRELIMQAVLAVPALAPAQYRNSAP
jgi:hypothetical protein